MENPLFDEFMDEVIIQEKPKPKRKGCRRREKRSTDDEMMELQYDIADDFEEQKAQPIQARDPRNPQHY